MYYKNFIKNIALLTLIATFMTSCFADSEENVGESEIVEDANVVGDEAVEDKVVEKKSNQNIHKAEDPVLKLSSQLDEIISLEKDIDSLHSLKTGIKSSFAAIKAKLAAAKAPDAEVNKVKLLEELQKELNVLVGLGEKSQTSSDEIKAKLVKIKGEIE